MNKVTTSQASQNFSVLTNAVDENNTVIITRKGKETYVMMKYDEYMELRKSEAEGKIGKGFWIRESPTVLTYIRDKGKKEVQIVTLHLTEENLVEAYNVDIIPAENLDISFEDGVLDLTINGYERTSYGGILDKLLEDPSDDAEMVLAILEQAIKRMLKLEDKDIVEGRIR